MPLTTKQRNTYLSQIIEVLFPREDDDAGTVTMILKGVDKIPTIVDCPLDLWYALRNRCPGRVWRGQWVYWRLDEWGFLLGEALLFDEATPVIHASVGGEN